MDMLTGVLIISQLLFMVIAGVYFFVSLRNQSSSKNYILEDSKKELEKMKKLRDIKLSKPLTEKTRPEEIKEIIGQQKGIEALKAAICGPNPQHVIIYGPPGIGKTAAARIILKEAVKGGKSPFLEKAPFIELDATTLQFDERSIADPLMGSVHDPIYHGAGSYGQAGVPQPKQGAVTDAHGGILFIDEIGELHSVQMNRLLKVLEDRKVMLFSTYYSKGNANIPKHIHDIFQNGFPADFRLIGATTKSPEDIPPALRSRCTEIFFRPLKTSEVCIIAENAAKKAGFCLEEKTLGLIGKYCENGRDTVNIIQTAAAIAIQEDRYKLRVTDLENVIEQGQYSPVIENKVSGRDSVGTVSALVVAGASKGAVIEIEAVVSPCVNNQATVKITGIADEEEINKRSGKIRRKSQVCSSVENVMTLLSNSADINVSDYHVHVNFQGAALVDGPSAGTAIFCALYSAFSQIPVSSRIAMTGELSIKGKICPVGGVSAKLEAAFESGITKVYILQSNWKDSYASLNGEIIQVSSIHQIVSDLFGKNITNKLDMTHISVLQKLNF